MLNMEQLLGVVNKAAGSLADGTPDTHTAADLLDLWVNKARAQAERIRTTPTQEGKAVAASVLTAAKACDTCIDVASYGVQALAGFSRQYPGELTIKTSSGPTDYGTAQHLRFEVGGVWLGTVSREIPWHSDGQPDSPNRPIVTGVTVVVGAIAPPPKRPV